MPKLSREQLVELHKRNDMRPAIYVFSVYAGIAAVMASAIVFHQAFVYACAFVLIGALQHQLSIVHHEANHYLLFKSKRVNEWAGRVSAYLIGFTMSYRVTHFEHHRSLGEETDPDLANYEPFPMTRFVFFLDLLTTLSGWKAIRQFFAQSKQKQTSEFDKGLLGVVVTQLALLSFFTLSGHFWLYFLLWILPLVTLAKTLAYLRNVAEHLSLSGERGGSRFRTIYCGGRSPSSR